MPLVRSLACTTITTTIFYCYLIVQLKIIPNDIMRMFVLTQFFASILYIGYYADLYNY